MLPRLLVWYVVFLFSTTFHEFSHSIIAYFGGDRTAYEGGTASLDPVPHIKRSPFGLVVIPLISFFLSGWMIGWASAPYDPQWARRHPRRHAAMSAAGPFANFLLAGLALVAIRILVGAEVLEFGTFRGLEGLVQAPTMEEQRSALGALAMALSVMFTLNVLLGAFNLLPVLPLDGSGVLEGLFPRQLGGLFDQMRQSGIFYFLGLIIAWKIFPYIGIPILTFATRLLV